MKNWFKFLIVLIVCIIVVGAVYIWRFGIPNFLSRDDRYIKQLYENITFEDETVQKKLDNKKIIFTKSVEQENLEETVEFNIENGVVSCAVNQNSVSEKFVNGTIKEVFMAAVRINKQSEENAIYSIIPDIIATKALQEDGYQLTTQNGVTRFSMKTNGKFNLANGAEVYIKVSDLENVSDVIKYKLQSKIIEKPGIALEKTVSYSKDLVFIIYEKEKLTDRTYNSFLALIDVLIKDKSKVEYIKANYPVITRSGTLTLQGVTISLNEKINENNIHIYNMPEQYEYMIIRMNANEVEK